MNENVLTEEQYEHIRSIVEKFSVLAQEKYIKGQAEHGGDLWTMSPRKLVREARSEAIDQFIYLYTLIQWVDKLVLMVDERDKEIERLKDELNKGLSN